jgi:hypothetical protein
MFCESANDKWFNIFYYFYTFTHLRSAEAQFRVVFDNYFHKLQGLQIAR